MKVYDNKLLDLQNPVPKFCFDYSASFIYICNRWLLKSGYDCKYLPVKSLSDNQFLNKKISIETISSFIEHCIEITKNDLLGFELGKYFGQHSYGILNHAIKSSSNLGEALDILDNYFPILCTYTHLKSKSDNEYYHLFFESKTETKTVTNFFHLFMPSCFISTLSDVIKEKNFIYDISLTMPEPEGWKTDKGFLGYKVNFGADSNCIRFPIESLTFATQYPDPISLKLLRQLFNEYLATHVRKENIIDKVEQFIEKHPSGVPNHEDIANQLGMSSRTLRRKLKQLKTSYQSILDNVRKKKAVALLRDTDLRLYQVSELVGYKDLSNFRRAFKKWTGSGLRDYR